MRTVLPLSSALLVAFVATGCKRPDPIPDGADGVAAWLFRNEQGDDEAEIARAMWQLDDALGLTTMADDFEGVMVPLDAESVASVGRVAVESLPEGEQAAVTEADLDAGTWVVLADQQGIVVATVIPCRVEDAVGVFVRTDQDEIHGGYDAYDRQYTSDFDAFDADTPLSWRTDYTVSLLGATYDATILGELRWVDDDRPLAIARAYLPEPGVFTSGGKYFRQDYQLDLFYPAGPGRMVHLFAVWRDMDIAGFSSSNAAYISTVSDAFRRADEEIAAVCNPG